MLWKLIGHIIIVNERFWVNFFSKGRDVSTDDCSCKCQWDLGVIYYWIRFSIIATCNISYHLHRQLTPGEAWCVLAWPWLGQYWHHVSQCRSHITANILQQQQQRQQKVKSEKRISPLFIRHVDMALTFSAHISQKKRATLLSTDILLSVSLGQFLFSNAVWGFA